MMAGTIKWPRAAPISLCALVTLSCVAACSAPESSSPPSKQVTAPAAVAPTPAVAARPATNISMAPEDRYPRCMAAYQRFRDEGVIVAGGAQPRLVVSKWRALSDADKEMLIEVAACIMGAGVSGPQRVTLLADVSGAPLHVADTAGDYPFAEFARGDVP